MFLSNQSRLQEWNELGENVIKIVQRLTIPR